MEPTKNVGKAIDDRLKKARGAWAILKKTLIANNQIDIKLKVILFDSLIGSILLYGLNTMNINSTLINKLQSFYSGCIRYLAYGRYEDQKNQIIPNIEIRKNTTYPQ